jgi:hypothetical protein
MALSSAVSLDGLYQLVAARDLPHEGSSSAKRDVCREYLLLARMLGTGVRRVSIVAQRED